MQCKSMPGQGYLSQRANLCWDNLLPSILARSHPYAHVDSVDVKLHLLRVIGDVSFREVTDVAVQPFQIFYKFQLVDLFPSDYTRTIET